MGSYILAWDFFRTMLRNTFVLLDRIGPQRESSLWRAGIETWDDFVSARRIKGVAEETKAVMDLELLAADEKLEREDARYFSSRLYPKDHWRCLQDLGKSVIYLDIETTGISLRSPITVVGIFDGKRMHSLVRGRNLNHRDLGAILSSASAIVTFNGSSFDLPVIKAQFPNAVPDIPHIDLKHALRRLGFVGGLKRIERELDIVRDKRVEYMTGEDAVYLWRLWEKNGNMNALDLLTEYNAADCVNMQRLAEFAYKGLKRRTFDAVTGSGKVEYDSRT